MEKLLQVVTDKKTFTILITMKQIEEFLPANLFCRTHKSWIVALGRIVSFDNEVVLLNDMMHPIGVHYKNRFFNSVTILVNESSKSYPNCFDKQCMKKRELVLDDSFYKKIASSPCESQQWFSHVTFGKIHTEVVFQRLPLF